MTNEQLDRLIVSSCHSDPRTNTPDEYRLTIDEIRTILASSSTASVSEPDNSQAVALSDVQERQRFEAYLLNGETREFWEYASPRQIANAAWFAALSTPASKEPK